MQLKAREVVVQGHKQVSTLSTQSEISQSLVSHWFLWHYGSNCRNTLLINRLLCLLLLAGHNLTCQCHLTSPISSIQQQFFPVRWDKSHLINLKKRKNTGTFLSGTQVLFVADQTGIISTPDGLHQLKKWRDTCNYFWQDRLWCYGDFIQLQPAALCTVKSSVNISY